MPIASSLDSAIFRSGVYSFTTYLTLSSDAIVTLDGGGNSASVFIFITAGYLRISNNAMVVLRNGARASNVFWVLGE